ncbi:glycosyl transferase family 1 [Putridiphycobacter roseus]|uniref:Glycosyl transferase family 1 n=2 Tax=Putridiphycobacter roseus TaxID=2219161 RepID=A0A2W1NCI5_9FLAO|nr:glycosyl transferase family 1 [Putridiphycobacter roseus]
MTKSPLKITIVGPAHPFRGGIALGNERLANEFQIMGHEVNIITFTTQYPDFLFPGKTQYSTAKAPSNLKIERKLSSVNPLNWIKVGREIKKAKPDIVIFRYWLPFMGPCFGTIGRIIKRNKHTKIITILDNVIPHESRIGDKQFTKYFIKPNDGFIAMSRSVAKDLKTFTNTTCLYNPHPLFDNYGPKYNQNAAKNYLNLDVNLKYVLFFGLVRDYKGLDLLLKAFQQFDYKKYGVKLLVAGEYYANEEEYRLLIDELGLKDVVIVKNEFIKDEEVGYYFSAAEIIAQPYKSATQSGVTQIAYHFETPMLVTNVGGLPEMVPHEKVGYVVERDPIQIKDALDNYFTENRTAEFQANFAPEKDKFTWDKMAIKVIELAKK